jgi:hypothetical protein
MRTAARSLRRYGEARFASGLTKSPLARKEGKRHPDHGMGIDVAGRNKESEGVILRKLHYPAARPVQVGISGTATCTSAMDADWSCHDVLLISYGPLPRELRALPSDKSAADPPCWRRRQPGADPPNRDRPPSTPDFPGERF